MNRALLAAVAFVRGFTITVSAEDKLGNKIVCIFLERSSLAVLLLSPSYFESGHCQHEAKDAVAQRDSRKLQVLPVRLTEITDTPAWLKELQHLRLADGDPPSVVVDRGIALLGAAV